MTTKTLRIRTEAGWVTKPQPDLPENRLTAEEVDDNFLALERSLGTAAAADVTTSPTDITADRLLKVGAFGLGGSLLPTSSDANNAIESGFYYTAWNSANVPAEITSTALLQVHRAFNLVSQLIFQNQVRWYVRFSTDTGATWTSWSHFAAQTLGTVSQSAGVPTGAIIERGNNSNGEYVKFADGTLICLRSMSSTVTGALDQNVAVGNVFRSTTPYTWTFPVALSSLVPSLSVSARTNAAVWGKVRVTGVGTAEIELFGALQSTAVPIIDVGVVGRWF